LKSVWAEALLERGSIRGDGVVSFDTFVRINSRLEEIIHDVSATQVSKHYKVLDEYHTSLFLDTTDGEEVMSFSQFLECVPIKQGLGKNVFDKSMLQRLWKALPKQPLGAYFASEALVQTDRGVVRVPRVSQSDGIRVDAFQSVMNEILDVLLNESTSE
jgi:hypothetical protein